MCSPMPLPRCSPAHWPIPSPPRWEHVVTASVRSASAGNAGRVPIPGGWGRLALVTDGVHRELSPAEIAAVLAHGHHPATAARELTDLALLAGGGDNASATVVEVPLVPALPAQRTDTSPAFPEVPGEAADSRRSSCSVPTWRSSASTPRASRKRRLAVAETGTRRRGNGDSGSGGVGGFPGHLGEGRAGVGALGG